MSLLPLTTPPERICILRLSAIGDISHTLPTVRALQAHWPATRITWIIGKTEHALVGDIPEIDFIIFDKQGGWQALLDVRRQLRGQRFDVLLHMQVALRASLVSLFVDAPVKLGFDRARAKDGQWLFTNQQVAARKGEHVLEGFLGFAAALGVSGYPLRWDIPVPEAATEFAGVQLPGEQPTLLISPCSSMAYRNWSTDRYAAVADYAVSELGMRVVLTGGRQEIERQYGDAILEGMREQAQNFIGQSSLKQLLALIRRSTVVLAPDSGPAHLATAVGTPVIGLYACTNPDRARPYLSGEYLVNRYPQAVEKYLQKDVACLPFGTRVRNPAAMELIDVDSVQQQLLRLMGGR